MSWLCMLGLTLKTKFNIKSSCGQHYFKDGTLEIMATYGETLLEPMEDACHAHYWKCFGKCTLKVPTNCHTGRSDFINL